MPLTPEQEWTMVACGLIAHADDVLEVGEWDKIVAMIDARLSEEEGADWLALLLDRAKLEARFSEIQPPLPAFAEELLEQCWSMALADGHGSEVEAEVHDRIAERAGIEADRAAQLRQVWTRKAGERAEIVVQFAAGLANIDGRMDTEEAVQFDALLQTLPLSDAQRLECSQALFEPPSLDAVAERVVGLDMDQREGVLRDLAPIVGASHRGEREREAYLALADRAAIPRDRAERLLRGG